MIERASIISKTQAQFWSHGCQISWRHGLLSHTRDELKGTTERTSITKQYQAQFWSYECQISHHLLYTGTHFSHTRVKQLKTHQLKAITGTVLVTWVSNLLKALFCLSNTRDELKELLNTVNKKRPSFSHMSVKSLGCTVHFSHTRDELKGIIIARTSIINNVRYSAGHMRVKSLNALFPLYELPFSFLTQRKPEMNLLSTLGIVLAIILLRWLFNMFNITIQSKNDHQYIQIIHQIKLKAYLLI